VLNSQISTEFRWCPENKSRRQERNCGGERERQSPGFVGLPCRLLTASVENVSKVSKVSEVREKNRMTLSF
jgi:hypothetical protein